ncbi:hypothetical protein [Vibrio phage vB_VpP_DE10]|uniref:Uncharacterized protein n=1 Tax=Vibrio phage vB_VpP_DE10 TaxID=2861001 RepID=A0AAE7VK01_9CAUD|nr:hypothetical protein [Vibrio phage vB_VpP_DE10]
MATIRLNADKRRAILNNIMAEWKAKHPRPVAPKMNARAAFVKAYQELWYRRSGIEKAVQGGLTPMALYTSSSLHLYIQDRTGKALGTVWEYFRDGEGGKVKLYVPTSTTVVYNDDPLYLQYLKDKSADDKHEIDVAKWNEERHAQVRSYTQALDMFKTLKQLTDGWDGIEKYLPKEFEVQSTAVVVVPQLP